MYRTTFVSGLGSHSSVTLKDARTSDPEASNASPMRQNLPPHRWKRFPTNCIEPSRLSRKQNNLGNCLFCLGMPSTLKPIAAFLSLVLAEPLPPFERRHSPSREFRIGLASVLYIEDSLLSTLRTQALRHKTTGSSNDNTFDSIGLRLSYRINGRHLSPGCNVDSLQVHQKFKTAQQSIHRTFTLYERRFVHREKSSPEKTR